MSRNAFVLEPRDMLSFRDGREMWEAAAVARSLEVPWPSTLAGSIRHRLSRLGVASFDASTALGLEQLSNVEVTGAWIAECMADGEVRDVLFPAPGDCEWRKNGRIVRRYPIAPHARLANLGVTDLPDDLQLLGSAAPRGKPWHDAPRYWRRDELKKWLRTPTEDEFGETDVGHPGLVHDLRVHVRIEADTERAAEGDLFRVDAARYEADLRGAWFALLGCCAYADGLDGILHLGADRHAARLRALREDPFSFQSWMPDVRFGRRLRLLLITPGVFDDGYAPSPAQLGGATLVAAAVPRPEYVSGWNMATHGPKAGRRVAPAGSVYWVDVAEGNPHQWAESMWMRSIATSAQDQRDGFGVVLVGVAP